LAKALLNLLPATILKMDRKNFDQPVREGQPLLKE
jgi:hypothetical protein